MTVCSFKKWGCVAVGCCGDAAQVQACALVQSFCCLLPGCALPASLCLQLWRSGQDSAGRAHARYVLGHSLKFC